MTTTTMMNWQEQPRLGWVTVPSLLIIIPRCKNPTKTRSLIDTGLMKPGPFAEYEVVRGDSLGMAVYFLLPPF